MTTNAIRHEFQASFEQLGIDKSPVIDEKGDVIPDIELAMMLGDHFWLPKLTLKANEVTQFLLNQGCFDVIFRLEEQSACGFVIEEPDPKIKSQYGYPTFDEKVSLGLRKKIIDFTIKKTLGFSLSGVSLINRPGLYSFQEGDRYIRPLDNQVGLVISMWHDKLQDFNKALEITFDRTNERNIVR